MTLSRHIWIRNETAPSLGAVSCFCIQGAGIAPKVGLPG